MKNYEVNDETMAIIGLNEKNSKVLEKEREYLISTNSYEVLDYSCQYFGSSYLGRLDGSKKMLDAKYKLPIIVEESAELIFFPISSPENEDCIWIALQWFDDIVEINKKIYIRLKNGRKIEVKTSKYSIKNQVMRASRLNYILKERKLSKNK